MTYKSFDNKTTSVRQRVVCRGCGHHELSLIHDFGLQPLAGEFPGSIIESMNAKRFPLDLSECSACGLLQVTNVVPQEYIFNQDYKYSSSSISWLVQHFCDFAEYFTTLLPRNSKILEFGCNDGVFLNELSARNYRCTGIDASSNMAATAKSRGFDVHIGFFSCAIVESKCWTNQFDAVTCSNVYAHVDNLVDMTQAAWLALRDDGLFFIEVHDGSQVIAGHQFDTVYHEHLTYFTPDSIRIHLAMHGFRIESCDRTPMHGGSLRIIARKINGSLSVDVQSSFDFAKNHSSCESSILLAQKHVSLIATQHGKVWGYGAAGRSQMFLNFTSTHSYFEQVFDDAPLRQNRFIVGTKIPIVSYEPGSRKKGACIVLAWPYISTILPKIENGFDAVYTILPYLKKWT